MSDSRQPIKISIDEARRIVHSCIRKSQTCETFPFHRVDAHVKECEGCCQWLKTIIVRKSDNTVWVLEWFEHMTTTQRDECWGMPCPREDTFLWDKRGRRVPWLDGDDGDTVWLYPTVIT